mmetsp:Transcript_10717/g.23042  ORF Transcript_10717/g.23042 Transcript_10717/m.23042 type:complete len:121 (-) Transcript_10717:537-899(-)|eukprot:CAMPEP_0202901480 /NCGR_PEP_ID=MMETSP1392-20130828/14278_1 /ASSEMBLY_ACC=CAM_ASM_000868 /TAXON_ID=225041 /ORGANISM="Chlamydomonas chlamydogama, Strain SAG 11-48b" /LENGTH=120 /DNA_ID=CAMNT_0049588043 /DNA_START=81 /DNA_END=443 /DNA_ORIENTATION=+
MYDFCFTPIYAIFLAVGGLYGFLVKGSVESLGGGLGSAALLTALTYMSFLCYKSKKSCKPTVFASLLVSAGLCAMMYMRFAETRKIHTLLIAVASGFMSAYYVWNLTLFKPHSSAPKKAK